VSYFALKTEGRLVPRFFNKKFARRWARVVEELVGHIFAMAVVIFGFYLISAWTEFLMGHNRLLFGWLPWHWLIDAADAYTFVAFVIAGTRMSIKAYGDEH
jgi:hypothetical protein